MAKSNTDISINSYKTVLDVAKTAMNDSSKNLEKVFVISLLPSTPLTYEGSQMRIQHVNEQLKALCEGNDYKDFVTFVNVYPELLHTGSTPLSGCTANGSDNDGNTFSGYEPHGDPQYYFTSDGLHPNAAGYAKIAGILKPLLDTETQYTVTLSATENGTAKGDDGGTGFTKASFQIGGQNPSDTTVTVPSGTHITVSGSVWLSGTAGDYLDSVKVNDSAKPITKGQDFEVTITDNTTIVADYKYLESPPAEETNCTVTLSATEDGSAKGDDSGIGFTKASFQIGGQNPSDTTVTVPSGTQITVLGSVWLSGTAGDYLDSVTVNGTSRSITKGEIFEITVTDTTTSIVADYKWSETKPSGGGTDPTPGGEKVTVNLSATEGGNEKSGNFVQAVFSVNGTPVTGATVQVEKMRRSPSTATCGPTTGWSP